MQNPADEASYPVQGVERSKMVGRRFQSLEAEFQYRGDRLDWNFIDRRR